MDMLDKISIIVPVYNVEKYLSTCIESLTNQKYRNFEIILVNDGSKDNSGHICDKYSAKDNRIKVIHKANEGVSIARNCGLENATGKYITFVDGDDYVHENIYEVLYKDIITSQCDLAMCRFYRENENGDVYIGDEPLRDGKYDKQEIFNDLILPMIGNDFENIGNPLIMGAIWRCLYKRETINKNNIEFPIIKIAEDMLFHLKYLGYSNSVYVNNTPLYYYRVNSISATRKYIPNLWETLEQQLNMVNEELINLGLHNDRSIERIKVTSIYFLSWSFTNECHPSNKKSFIKILKEMNEISNTNFYNKSFSWKNISTAPVKEKIMFSCIKLKLYILVYWYNNKKLKAVN